MNEILLLLSAIPGIEARGAAIYFICSKQLMLIPFAVLINFIAVLMFVKLLDAAHVPERVEHALQRFLKKRILRFERWFKKYGNIALFLIIALPSSGIGSFSGAFIGRIFGLNRLIFYLSILFAIIISLIPAALIAYGIDIIGIRC